MKYPRQLTLRFDVPKKAQKGIIRFVEKYPNICVERSEGWGRRGGIDYVVQSTRRWDRELEIIMVRKDDQ